MICRLCLKNISAENAIFLYETSDILAETKLVKIIAKFLYLEIAPDDAISTSVCTDCCDHLEDFHSFWQLVEQKQNTLVHKEFLTVNCDALKWPNQLDDELLANAGDLEIDEKPLDLNSMNLGTAVVDATIENGHRNTESYDQPEIKHADDVEFSEAKLTRLNESTDVSLDEMPLLNLRVKLRTPKTKSCTKKSTVKRQPKRQHVKAVDDSLGPNARVKRTQKRKIKVEIHNDDVDDDETEAETTEPEQEQPKRKPKGISKVSTSKKYEETIADFMPANCDLCDFTAQLFSDLRVHFEEIHKSKAYLKCCNKIFWKPSKLMEHVRRHLNPELFKCNICQKTLSSQDYLQTHMETIHNKHFSFEGATHPCDKCDKSFSSQKRLENHLQKHDNVQLQYECDTCNKSFANVHRLRRHIQSIHEDLHPHVCDICGRKFKFKPSFERHLLEHQGVYGQPQQCQTCGVWLKNEHSLRLHKFTHDNRDTECPHCGKLCTSRTARRAHIKYAHKLQLNLQCTYCDKIFKQQRNLEEHMAIHTGLQLYNCPHCPKECRSRSNMYVHIKQRHAEEWLKAKMARSHNPTLKTNV